MFDEIRDCKSKQRIRTNLTLTNKVRSQCKMQFKLDIGAAGNLLPYREFNKIFPDVSIKDLHKSIDPDITLEAYNGLCINQIGTCKLNVNGTSKELCQAIFFLVPDYCHPILGLQSCIDLDLIDVKCPTTNTTSSF